MTRIERKTLSWTHEGYMDGILGLAPDEDLDYPGSEYETGWLHGDADREAGLTAPKYPCGTSLPALKGVEVTIPKGVMVKTSGKPPKAAGRSYKVKALSVNAGIPAYFTNGFFGEFVRPTSASVQWAGTGGLWTEALLEDVVLD